MSLPPFCPNCAQKIPVGSPSCPHCSWDSRTAVEGHAIAAVTSRRRPMPKVINRTTVRVLNDDPIPVTADTLQVVVTDFRVSFVSLIIFLVKLTLAAIPAVLIVVLIYTMLPAALAALLIQ